VPFHRRGCRGARRIHDDRKRGRCRPTAPTPRGRERLRETALVTFGAVLVLVVFAVVVVGWYLYATGARRAIHPLHYTEHPPGVECITIVEHIGFNLGNAIK